MKSLAKVTRNLSRENSRGERNKDDNKGSFKSGSAKIMKLKNVTRAMSGESSDSPIKGKQSGKVSSFKTHSGRVRTLSAVTRKLGEVSPDSGKEEDEDVRGRSTPFKEKGEKVKILSNISRSFSNERGSSDKEKSRMKSSVKKVGMLSKTTRMLSTESKESLLSFDDGAESEEKSSGARPKTSKWRQKRSPSNMSRISSLFGSEVEIPQEERPKSSRRSRSEEKGRQETGRKKDMGSYTDIYQVFSQIVTEVYISQVFSQNNVLK